MKQTFLTFLFLFAFLRMTSAQELTVKSFQIAPMDLSASTSPRLDLNKQPCALVKVRLPLTGVAFSGNVLGEVENHEGVYWVYMSQGSYMLQVRHPEHVAFDVNFRDYGIRGVEEKTTYVLTVSKNVTQESDPYTIERADDYQGLLERMKVLEFLEAYRIIYDNKNFSAYSKLFGNDCQIYTEKILKKSDLSETTQMMQMTLSSYLNNVQKVFKSNRDIVTRYDDIIIYKHPTRAKWYGVSMHVMSTNGSYQDDGYLFLMIEFVNEQPVVQIYAWQPAQGREGRMGILTAESFIIHS